MLESIEAQEFTVLPSNIEINKAESNEDTLHIDLNSDFTTGLGSSEERALVESLVNTLSYNLNTDNIIITFNGEAYSSGHTVKEHGESFKANLKNEVELKAIKSSLP